MEKQDVTPLLKQIESLGGWPVIDNEFNEDSWDLEEILARIRLELDKNYLFTQKVNPDTKNTSSILFFVSIWLWITTEWLYQNHEFTHVWHTSLPSLKYTDIAIFQRNIMMLGWNKL